MADLFSPLTIGTRALPNRIVAAPTLLDAGQPDGFINAEVAQYYATWARGGAGLVITELLCVAPLRDGAPQPGLGLYHDAFVPGLRRLVAGVRTAGACVIVGLDAPPVPPEADLRPLAEAFLAAIWRAHSAGADGVLLSTADGGLLHQLLSPRLNQRQDGYGQSQAGRQHLLMVILEEANRWLGRRLILAVRLLPDEFTPGGLGLQDARMLARRLTAAGVRMLEVATPVAATQVARFPGWAVPLVSSIKRITDVPVIGSGELDDPHLADSVVRDGSLDLVIPGHAPQHGPEWPRFARRVLEGYD
ncbi:MAG: NADH:flavin oxidoreductase [Oscillochloridaceae bacterium umkhey_bin13]